MVNKWLHLPRCHPIFNKIMIRFQRSSFTSRWRFLCHWFFFSLKMFSFLNLESDMHTDAPKAFATYSLKTSEIRTTNQLQPIVSTTGNTTTSHVSTFSNNTLHSRPPMTSMSSTKTNTSFFPTQSQSIPFGSQHC